MSDLPVCPDCGEPLKRCYSSKKEKHYWFCEAPQEECGAVFADDEGKPMLHVVKKGEPDASMPCPACGAPMVKITGAKNGDFLSCSTYPNCRATIDIVDGELPPVCPDDPEHGHMRRREGKNGKFFSCRSYPECKAVIDFSAWKKSR